jgi:hypothetical protein
MAKKSFTKLENFFSEIRSQHTPRSDRFEVIFTMPGKLLNRVNGRQLSLYCEEAQIPGLAATNLPIKIGPWTEYRTQNLEYLTTEMTFTFIIDEKWRVREAFEEWISLSANPVNKEVKFYNDYVSVVDIRSIGVNNDILAEWQLVDAAPKLINLTPVSWNNNGLIRMSVSMSAKRWYKKTGTEEADAIQAQVEEDTANGIQQSGIRTFIPPIR